MTPLIRTNQHLPRYIYVVMLLALITLFLPSCTLGPDYEKPTLALDDSFHNDDNIEKTEKHLRDIKWWGNFNDPVLNTLINLATLKNLDIKIAAKNIQMSQEKINGLVSLLFPEFDIKSSLTKVSPNQSMEGNQNVGPAFTTVKTGFQTLWELDFFGAARRGIEAEQANYEAEIQKTNGVKIAIYASVAQHYMMYQNAKIQIQLTEKIVKNWEVSLKLKGDLEKSGYIAKQQNLITDSMLMQARSKLIDLKTQQKVTADHLASLVGKHPEKLQCILDQTPNEIPNITNEKILSNIPSDAVFNRPDVQIAERNLAEQTALIGLQKSRLFPQFSITGDYAWQTYSSKNLFKGNNLGWSIGPFVKIPLFDFGRIQSEVDMQTTKRDISSLQFAKSVMLALQDIEKNLMYFDTHNEQVHFSYQNMTNYKTAYDLTQKKYKAGLINYMEVLDDELPYLIAEQNYNNALTNLNLSFINVYKSLGGGYGA